MTKYYAIDPDYTYSENTAEYGFGDYPEKLAIFLGVVEAASRREAISKIKKTVEALEGKIAGFGENTVIATPSKVFDIKKGAVEAPAAPKADDIERF